MQASPPGFGQGRRKGRLRRGRGRSVVIEGRPRRKLPAELVVRSGGPRLRRSA